jgi:hypothetical protein
MMFTWRVQNPFGARGYVGLCEGILGAYIVRKILHDSRATYEDTAG